MKKLPFLLLLLTMVACNLEKAVQSSEQPAVNSTAQVEAAFTVQQDMTEALTFDNLRLYPIEATADHIEAHAELARFKNLKEAIDLPGFHITEKKAFGRSTDRGTVNTLTIQNKSQDTVYLMAGDVLKGGKQDRLIAEDMIVPPRTITDISVFCVERNRWEVLPENGETTTASDKKRQYAFTNYYNCASNEVRKAAKQTRNQKAVWDKVGEWTALNNAQSRTESYTALEKSEEFTTKRDQYIEFFIKQMNALSNNTVGLIAVSGDKVLGADIFNHPTLFEKQLPVLLHAYVTDAITKGKKVEIDQKAIDKYAQVLLVNYENTLSEKREKECKFRYNGKIVHFSQL